MRESMCNDPGVLLLSIKQEPGGCVAQNRLHSQFPEQGPAVIFRCTLKGSWTSALVPWALHTGKGCAIDQKGHRYEKWQPWV